MRFARHLSRPSSLPNLLDKSRTQRHSGAIGPLRTPSEGSANPKTLHPWRFIWQATNPLGSQEPFFQSMVGTSLSKMAWEFAFNIFTWPVARGGRLRQAQ